MIRVTRRSKVQVVRLMNPRTGRDERIPPTPLRALWHHRNRAKIRPFTLAQTLGGGWLCLWNLEHLGFDYMG